MLEDHNLFLKRSIGLLKYNHIDYFNNQIILIFITRTYFSSPLLREMNTKTFFLLIEISELLQLPPNFVK